MIRIIADGTINPPATSLAIDLVTSTAREQNSGEKEDSAPATDVQPAPLPSTNDSSLLGSWDLRSTATPRNTAPEKSSVRPGQPMNEPVLGR